MAYYAYKTVMTCIPVWFEIEYIKLFQEKTGREYNSDPNYDGDMWLLTAEYIEYLQRGQPADYFKNGIGVY